jgi:MFS family permease
MGELQKKIFIALCLAIFSAMLGMGIVAPLLPVYAQHYGATGFAIGLVFASFSISRTFLLPLIGKLSDKRGRKIFITSGLFLFSLTSIGYLTASNIPFLILTRTIQGIAAAMVIPIALAYMGEITPQGREGTYMGTFNLFFYGGLATGPILGGIVKDAFGMNSSFYAMGIISFIGFLFSLIFLPEKRISPTSPSLQKGFRQFFKPRSLKGIFTYRLCFSIGIGVTWAFLPIFGDNVLNLSSSQIGLLISLNIFIATLLQTPFGKLADRIPKGWFVIIGGIMGAGSLIIFPFTRNFHEIFLANLLLGISGGIAMPALTALVVEKGKDIGEMGSMMSLFILFHSIGMIIGPILAGLTSEYASLTVTFIAGGGIGLIGVIGFAVSLKEPAIASGEK